jgi:hypothetical protein
MQRLDRTALNIVFAFDTLPCILKLHDAFERNLFGWNRLVL